MNDALVPSISPALSEIGADCSGASKYSPAVQLPLVMNDSLPLMSTRRLETFSVVRILLALFVSSTVSPRLTGSDRVVSIPIVPSSENPGSLAATWDCCAEPSATVYVSPGISPEHSTLCNERMAPHVGKPVGAKVGTLSVSGFANEVAESGSPSGTVMLTSAPGSFGVPIVPGKAPENALVGALKARLSFEVKVSASEEPRPSGPPLSGMSAVSVCVLQRSFGSLVPETDRPLIVSTPVWKHGPTMTCGLLPPPFVTVAPLSRSVQPVQPDSVNGLPPLPVRIVASCTDPFGASL